MGGLIWKKRKVNISFGRECKKFVVKVVPFWYEGFGLMFTRIKTAKALLFEYSFSSRMTIFSSFIPYKFLALWINCERKIVGVKVVEPGEKGIEPGEKFKKLIEIPMTENYSELVDFILKNKNNFNKFSFTVDKI